MSTARIVLLGVGLLLVTTSGSQAQPSSTFARSDACESNMKDMKVAATAPLDRLPLLAGFHLGFPRGDHKVRRLGVLTEGRFASFSMSDQNGDDTYSARATWLSPHVKGTTGKVFAIGGGKFDIRLPGEKPANHALILSGFEFRRKDGTDANLRAVGVWLDGEKNSVRVTLMDDQGPDFRGFEQTIGIALTAGLVPFGQLASIGVTSTDTLQRLNTAPAGKFRPYAVTVQYAWVPNEALAGTDVLTGTSNRPSSGKNYQGNPVLQGFEFYFTESDHHLGEIGVLPPRLGGQNVMSRPPEYAVVFRDQNEDDHKRWAVAYAKLK